MNKWVNEEFKKKLSKEIADIELNSNVEIVVLIRESSGNYNDIHLIIASVTSLIIFSFFIFSPFVFGDYLIYMGTILAFFIGLILSFFTNVFSKIFIKEERMKRNVEIMARASFQKGGIHNTLKNTGLLIYISLFEKQCVFIADKGITNNIPKDEFNSIENNFNKIFQNKIPSLIIDELRALKSPFSKYIPSITDDINELDDNMEIVL